jgi:hypothetical protein
MSPSNKIKTGGHVATTTMLPCGSKPAMGFQNEKTNEIRGLSELNSSGFEELSHAAEFLVAAIEEIAGGEF